MKTYLEFLTEMADYKTYHGSQKVFYEFDRSKSDSGNDALGVGYYFTDDPIEASGYSFEKEPEEGSNIRIVKLTINNPIILDWQDKPNQKPLNRTKVIKLLKSSPYLKEVLQDFGDVSYSGFNKVFNDAVESYIDFNDDDLIGQIHLIYNDFYRNDLKAFAPILKKVSGYDGIIKTFDDGRSHYVIWDYNQIKKYYGEAIHQDTLMKYSKKYNPLQHWFRNSKVIDKDGNPLVVYHGSDNDFEKFEYSKIGSKTDKGMWGRGFYFSDYGTANRYGSFVKEVYLSIQNPYIIDNSKTVKEVSEYLEMDESTLRRDDNGFVRPYISFVGNFTSEIKDKGHDGIIVKRDKLSTEYIVFNPNQIKSIYAKDFNPNSDNIYEDFEKYNDVIDFASDKRFHNLIYGNPNEKEIKEFNNNINNWKTNIYTPKIIRLYHGTSAVHNVSDQGLLRTANSRKKSFQSTPGFVYLSIFPDMARKFAQIAYPHDDVIVYQVDLPIYKLLPDKDQLFNKRLYGDIDIKSNLANSIIFGHGAMVKGDIANYDVKVYKEYPRKLEESNDSYFESDDFYSYYDLKDDITYEIFQNLKDHQETIFYKINPDQYHNALKEFMEHGMFIKFPTKTIYGWKDLLLRNILMLHSLTEINGHTSQFPIDEFKEVMFDEDSEEYNKHWSYNSANDYMEDNGMSEYLPLFSNGHYVLSDYGLESLMNLSHELNRTNKPEEIIVIINKILDVVHPRSDLSELFIDGGQTSLSKISNWIGENFDKYNYKSINLNESYEYEYCCISPKSSEELDFIIDNMKEISKENFFKHVKINHAIKAIASGVGVDYSSNKNPKEFLLKDWNNQYYKINKNGIDAYILVNSGVEHIFKNTETSKSELKRKREGNKNSEYAGYKIGDLIYLGKNKYPIEDIYPTNPKAKGIFQFYIDGYWRNANQVISSQGKI